MVLLAELVGFYWVPAVPEVVKSGGGGRGGSE